MSNYAEDSISKPHQPAIAKKPYKSPHLTEWGSIVDLTRGGAGGFDDLPLGVGGTKGV